MPKQSEQILEEQLVTNLQKLGYQYVLLSNELALVQNLKVQLEKHTILVFRLASLIKYLTSLTKVLFRESQNAAAKKAHHSRQR